MYNILDCRKAVDSLLQCKVWEFGEEGARLSRRHTHVDTSNTSLAESGFLRELEGLAPRGHIVEHVRRAQEIDRHEIE